MNKIMEQMPKMLMGEELMRALEILPEYDENIRTASDTVRLVALADIYKIFLPNQMSVEIYSKLYLALLRSLQKKQTRMAVQQYNENFKAIQEKEFTSIIGGADSFSIIGSSGIGKSSSISRAINLITGNKIIETDNPYTKILPCIIVQTPFDASPKSALLEVLRQVDLRLDTKYYEKASKGRMTTDQLIGSVSNVCQTHVSLLIMDEIQHIVNHKAGNSLIGCLTQLINNSGISICLVGTPEVSHFFSQAFQLARRTLGLSYQALEYGEEFRHFCETVFRYQYVRQKSEIDDAIIYWLYEHSQGNLSIVISLIVDAQEIAILEGNESLDLISLGKAYTKRLAMLHDYIVPKKRSQTARRRKEKTIIDETTDTADDDICLLDMIRRAKNECKDVVEYLKEYIPMESVRI